MRLLIILLGALSVVACTKAPQVTVDGERIVGKYEGDVAAFLGIPFAEPPVGNLRWRAPQPLEVTRDRREATEFAPACMQTMRILDWYRYLAETFGDSGDYYDDLEVSEDCLYLNIWTPTLDEDARLPVMVWVHGGSNNSGWSYENNYHGHALAPEGVVVVSVAYRVGVFGFLSHPDLRRSGVVANFGLWDLVSSLHWIRRNIEQFGGDPHRVTLFGESAGAENILALMMAEAGQPLFHRAVLQSTAEFGLDMSSLDDEVQRGVALAELIGVKTLDELRQVDAAELLRVFTENFDDYYHSPVIDGQLILESTWDSAQAHRFAHHDLMIGTNDDEWLDYIDSDATANDVIEAARDNERIGGEDALQSVAAEADPRRAMDRLITAEAMVCPSQNIAANRSASGGNAFVYHFTRERDGEGGAKVGAFHGAEYAYIFGVHDDYMPTTETDYGLTRVMQQYWVNFAQNGDPNGDGLPEWPVFEPPEARMQELGDTVRTIPAIEPELCSAFERWNANRE